MTKSEKINLSATIGGPIFIAIVLAWVSWSFEAALKVRFDAEDKYNAETYATQKDFSQTDNTVRLGRTPAPGDGSFSAWGALGVIDVPFIFDGHVMSDVYMSAPILIATNGIVTKGTSSGTITATGWTNSTGTNCNVWPFGTAVSYILFDNAGNPIVTNVTISTTDAHAEPVQAGGKLTAASGLSGVWHVQ